MLHYVATLAEKSNSELLTLPDDLAVLEEASRNTLEQLSIEVNQLDNQIKKIANQMKQAQADVKNQMSEFLNYASEVKLILSRPQSNLKFSLTTGCLVSYLGF